MLRQYTLPIAGGDFPNRRGPTRREELARCTPGEPVYLLPEPDNPADPRAIAVQSCRAVQLGYIPADRAPRIAALLAKGRTVTAIFQGCAGHRGYVRIAFDGDVPNLPLIDNTTLE